MPSRQFGHDMLGEDLDVTRIPQIVFEKHPEYVELYNKAWSLAADHIATSPGMPVPRHMDEGFAFDRIWIWDTCFMVHFCKFAPDYFPGIQSLDNFYRILYDFEPTTSKVHHVDNPPLFAWVEYEYAKFTGDTSRIHRILVEKQYLQKHYHFIETVHAGYRHPNGVVLAAVQKNECGYLWSGNPSGMDNTPRGNDDYSNLYWLDILAQQTLSARNISLLAEMIGEKAIQSEYDAEYELKKIQLNKHYFDEQDGSYYDIRASTYQFRRVLTPASFWPLLAEAASPERAARQIEKLRDPEKLGGKYPTTTVSRDDPAFQPDGRYWRGGIWLPMTYMIAKSLEKYGELDLAAEIADKIVGLQSDTYRQYEPHTIWECYSPMEPKPSTAKKPGEICRPDFCGWSALGPISLLIENIIGLYDINAFTRTVKLHRRKQGMHGIRNFRFGDVTADIIISDNDIKVKTNRTFTLEVNGQSFVCAAGETVIGQ